MTTFIMMVARSSSWSCLRTLIGVGAIVFFVSSAAVAAEDDVQLLQKFEVQTDGVGLTATVFLRDLALSELEFTQILEAMVRIGTITTLHFDKTPVSPVFVRELPRLTSLSHLEFNNTTVDASIFEAATKLEALKAVRIADCKVTGDILSPLGKCRALESIVLYRPDGIEGDIFSHFTQLRRLRVLAVNSANVTDVGLQAVKQYPAIKWLGLDGTSVTDEVFVVAESIPTLTLLGVTNTKVTKQRLEAFRAAHATMVIHPLPSP